MARIVTCECGQEMRVPDDALGRKGTCVSCDRHLTISEANSRLVEEPGGAPITPGPPAPPPVEVPTGGPPSPPFAGEPPGPIPPPPPPPPEAGRPAPPPPPPQAGRYEGPGAPGQPPGGPVPPPPESIRGGLPWDRRKDLGLFSALFKTIGCVLLKPTETFQQMHRSGGLGSPLLFLLIVATIVGLIVGLENMMLGSMFQGFLQQLAEWIAEQTGEPFPVPIDQFAAPGPAVVVIAIFKNVVVALLFSFVGGGITHLLLMIFKGANEDFETTFRTVSYTMGSVTVSSIIPLCGILIFPIWLIVAMIIGLREAHETTSGKATGAVLSPIVFCCCCVPLGLSALGAVLS